MYEIRHEAVVRIFLILTALWNDSKSELDNPLINQSVPDREVGGQIWNWNSVLSITRCYK